MSLESLLQILHGERAAIIQVLAGASPEELRYEPEGRWSVEGVLRHLMDFEADTLGALDALAAGQTPSYYGIKDWNAYNAERAARWPKDDGEDVVAALVRHREALEQRIAACTSEQLADLRFQRVIRAAGLHDFEHLPGIQERLALARGDKRVAMVHYAEIARNELLVLLGRMDPEAFEERLPGKWSIKEILLHLADRDRIWAGIVSRVSGGGPEEMPHGREELDAWNERAVAAKAHWSVAQVLYELGEARGLWNAAMLGAPASLATEERFQQWSARRLKHDRHHYGQILERFRNWRSRNG